MNQEIYYYVMSHCHRFYEEGINKWYASITMMNKSYFEVGDTEGQAKNKLATELSLDHDIIERLASSRPPINLLTKNPVGGYYIDLTFVRLLWEQLTLKKCELDMTDITDCLVEAIKKYETIRSVDVEG